MRWSTKQRIEFIETRLYWEGKISRKDLTGYFDISIPQSTKDIKAYIEKAPDNIRYDSKAKQYVAAEGFEPVLISPDSETYLQRLLTSDPGQEEFFCGSMPSFYNAPCIQRKIDPKILKYILKNINEGNAVHVEYQSMSGPGSLPMPLGLMDSDGMPGLFAIKVVYSKISTWAGYTKSGQQNLIPLTLQAIFNGSLTSPLLLSPIPALPKRRAKALNGIMA